MPLLIKILFFVALAAAFNSVQAQDTAGNFPKAVLVQLRAEHNRVAALKKDRRYKQLAEVEKDALNIRNATIKDFERNFKYCHVYYFIDTNNQRVIDKQFDRVLLNADGSPAKKLVFDRNGDDYVIAYYGYLSSTFKIGRTVEDSLRQIADAEIPFGRGLIVTNDKFQVLTYFYKFAYEDFVFKFLIKSHDLIYKSRHFDMEYYPFVKLFNLRLTDRQQFTDFRENYIMYRQIDNAPKKGK